MSPCGVVGENLALTRFGNAGRFHRRAGTVIRNVMFLVFVVMEDSTGMKGSLMISLAVFTGVVSLSSCTRSSVVPSTDAIPNTPANALPGVVRVRPGRFHRRYRRRFRQYATPQRNIFQWKTKAAERNWESIVIHHTAASRGNVNSIHETHLRRKDKNGIHWQGIGYHFVIGNGNGMPDGKIEPTFRWREQLQGAHAGVRKHNEQGIGIALIGNFELNPPTSAQLISIKRLVHSMRLRYKISSENIFGHRDIKSTDCPGKKFPMAEVSRGSSNILYGQQTDQRLPARLVGLEGNRAQ